jgi:hypothetical protein
MREFFSRLVGGGRSPEAPRELPRSSEIRREDSEILALREKKLRAELSAFIGEDVSDERFALAKKELAGNGDLPPLSAEEIRSKAQEIGRKFGWSPEAVPVLGAYEPMSDAYVEMGMRRKTFEEAFVRHLGRPAMPEDIAEARAIFENDPNIQQRWSQLIGEEVAQYARTVAEQLREPDNRQDLDGIDTRFGRAAK